MAAGVRTERGRCRDLGIESTTKRLRDGLPAQDPGSRRRVPKNPHSHARFSGLLCALSGCAGSQASILYGNIEGSGSWTIRTSLETSPES